MGERKAQCMRRMTNRRKIVGMFAARAAPQRNTHKVIDSQESPVLEHLKDS